MMTSHTSLYQSNNVDVGNAEHIIPCNFGGRILMSSFKVIERDL